MILDVLVETLQQVVGFYSDSFMFTTEDEANDKTYLFNPPSGRSPFSERLSAKALTQGTPFGVIGSALLN